MLNLPAMSESPKSYGSMTEPLSSAENLPCWTQFYFLTQHWERSNSAFKPLCLEQFVTQLLADTTLGIACLAFIGLYFL